MYSTIFPEFHPPVDIPVVSGFDNWNSFRTEAWSLCVSSDQGLLRIFLQTQYAVILCSSRFRFLQNNRRGLTSRDQVQCPELHSGVPFSHSTLRILQCKHISPGLSDQCQLNPGFCFDLHVSTC